MAHKYIKIAPNFHIFLNPAKIFKTEVNITFSSGGAFYENENQKGLTHLLEHCILSETKKLNSKELNRYLFERDIYQNASTSILTMNIILSSHKNYANEIVQIGLEHAFTPTISEETLEREKQIVIRELVQTKGSPEYKLTQTIKNEIYKPGSKELCDIIGDLDVIKKATLHDLYLIHKRILKHSHCLISISGGNIDEEKIIKLCKKYIKIFPYTKETHPINQNAINAIYDFKYKPIVSELAHENCILTFIIPLQINYENRSIRAIFEELYFSYPEGFLYKKLREELGLIYSLSYGCDESLQMMRVTFITEIDKVRVLIEETVKIFKYPKLFVLKKDVKTIKKLYIMRQEILSDNKDIPVSYFIDTLLDYDKEQTYEEYLNEIKKTKFQDIFNYVKQISDNINKFRIVIISRNKQIRKMQPERYLNIE